MTEEASKPPIKPKGRSAVSNGTRLFAEPGVDARTIWARRFRDLCISFANDLGGLESLTELQVCLIRRAASLSVASEKLEARLAAGEPVDAEVMSRLTGQLSRVADALGLGKSKPAVDVDATLDDILARRRGPGRPRKGPL
ncbi:hypothetical protein [Methylocystis echinoides]|uniref:hypothetical protein n=1 Tax=Methylocystis echinoides TaxID=29468 RepID=UPI00343A12FC